MAATAGRVGPVAVLVPNDAHNPAAMLGVLGAGRAFVAMDVRHATERSRRIAELAGISAVIVAGEEAQCKAAAFGPDIPVLDVDAMNAAPQRVPSSSISSDDLAFILYTSGSTGKPKGAIHPHCNCLHATMLATNAQRISHEDRLAQIVSFAVAGGVRNCFLALLNGASLHVMSPQVLQPAGLAHEINAQGITVLLAIPVIFRRMVEALGPGERWLKVRHVHLAGDRITWDDFDAFQRSFAPSTSLGVSLGSSECLSHCLHWIVDKQVRSTSSSLPVGRAMPDLSIALVDDQGEPVPDGEVGELVLSGRYLARGYHNDPELNARMFSTDPADQEIRIFRSGDLALRRPDGLYEFAGRKDHLVKLHGHRVELSEIEAALRGCVGVREAGVVVRRNEDGGARALAAYCELLPDGDGLLPRHLLWMLRQKLPDYMVPADLFILAEIPRLSGAKVDRSPACRAGRRPRQPEAG